MRPSWFSGMGKDRSEPSLGLLEKLYGLETIQFRIGPLSTQVYWCDPKKILSGPVLRAAVREVAAGRVFLEGGLELHARLVVLAAGVWTNEVLQHYWKVPGLTGRAGVAFLWPDEQPGQPFIRPWAPYRQIVAFNRGDGLWAGDGTSLKPESWSEGRETASLARCAQAVGRPATRATRLFGIRPYVLNAKPCYLEQPADGLWVATGGAKNGTVAAGWCAHEIVRKTS